MVKRANTNQKYQERKDILWCEWTKGKLVAWPTFNYLAEVPTNVFFVERVGMGFER